MLYANHFGILKTKTFLATQNKLKEYFREVQCYIVCLSSNQDFVYQMKQRS